MRKCQSILATLLMVFTGGMAVIVIYMAFVFPKLYVVWEQEGRALSNFQKLGINISDFFSQYGRLILPIFLLGFSGSLVWFIFTLTKKSTSNNNS